MTLAPSVSDAPYYCVTYWQHYSCHLQS